MGSADEHVPPRGRGRLTEDSADGAATTSLRRRSLAGALLAGAFVLFAVALEVISGLNANSRVSAWADRVVPLT